MEAALVLHHSCHKLSQSPSRDRIATFHNWCLLIEELEEYYLYSFAVSQENSQGVSLLSQAITQEMPEVGKICILWNICFIDTHYIYIYI